jgi:glycosyltransferase involved in cell wall biosynthesis
MHIAIDCRLMALPGAAGQYSGTVLIPYLLEKGASHDFFLVFDRKPPEGWVMPATATLLVLGPAASTAATRGLWYDYRLPALLSAYDIDVFLGMSGYISLRAKISQFLWLHDALFPSPGEEVNGWMGSWYRRRLPGMVKKASGIGVAVNDVTKVGDNTKRGEKTPENFENIVGDNTNKGIKNSVLIVGDNTNNGEGANKHWALPVAFVPGKVNMGNNRGTVGDNTNRGIDDGGAVGDNTNSGFDFDGMPYFLCIAGWQTTEEAVGVLLAFSAFKKRMQSGMKLVLAGQGPRGKDWQEKLSTFRYRADVVMLPNMNAIDAATLLYNAYALLHLPGQPQPKWLLAAMKCRVPVITHPLPAFLSFAGEALMFCTENAGEGLAQNMMRIYKDENYRSSLIASAYGLAGHMAPEIVAEKLISILENPV